jgi:polar amino acid transport system permease protein
MDGLVNTILLTILSLIIATLLGLLMAIGRTYGKPPISTLIYIYEKVFRGIPLIVIFFLIYLGLYQVGINLLPFTAAVIGLALRSSAYQAQIFRSAINSIPDGQNIAARSIGMSKTQSMRYVIIPQVLRLCIPSWSNEFTIVLKDTSIALALGVPEILRVAGQIYAIPKYFDLILPILILVAVIYLIIVISVNKALNYLEEKYKMVGFEVAVER